MRILFDQGTPAPLRHALAGHSVETAYEKGWSNLSNGDLLAVAEGAGFDLFMTTDQISAINRTSSAGGWPFWYCQPRAGRSFSDTPRRSLPRSLYCSREGFGN